MLNVTSVEEIPSFAQPARTTPQGLPDNSQARTYQTPRLFSRGVGAKF